VLNGRAQSSFEIELTPISTPLAGFNDLYEFEHYEMRSLVQWILESPRLFPLLHWPKPEELKPLCSSSSSDRTRWQYSELWTGQMWAVRASQIADGSQLFPLLLYVDEAVVHETRNRGMHPVYLYLGSLPSEERFKEANRLLVGYIPHEPKKQCGDKVDRKEYAQSKLQAVIDNIGMK
jgi:hypothetical protein